MPRLPCAEEARRVEVPARDLCGLILDAVESNADTRQLLARATSSEPADRAAAGQALAAYADDPMIADVVAALLHDPEDTAVTYETAHALFERYDRAGLDIVLTALAQADDDTTNWIRDALIAATQTRSRYDLLTGLLIQAGQAAPAAGSPQGRSARELLTWLTEQGNL